MAHIVLKDLSVSASVKNEKNEKIIVQNVSGLFKPGRLTAIMGPSGSGKSTLLNAVFEQCQSRHDAVNAMKRKKKNGLIVTGQVQTVHNLHTKNPLKVALVQQDDVLLSTCTVSECISLSAHLRLSHLSLDERRVRIDDTINRLHLNKCKDTYIGDAVSIKGVSGGEKRRVSIGMEFVTDPQLLLLDEPTTGLDNYTALSIMTLLHSLAHPCPSSSPSSPSSPPPPPLTAPTLICTLHQPSSHIYHLIDDLLILMHGRVVYHGPAQEHLLNYFTQRIDNVLTPTIDNHDDDVDDDDADAAADSAQLLLCANPADVLFTRILYPAEEVVTQTKNRSSVETKEKDKKKHDDDNRDQDKTINTLAITVVQNHNQKSEEKDDRRAGTGASSLSADAIVQARSELLINAWAKSTEAVVVLSDIDMLLSSSSSSFTSSSPSTPSSLCSSFSLFFSSFIHEFGLLFVRCMHDHRRHPMQVRAKLIQVTVLSLLYGALYQNLGTNQASVQTRTGALFFIILSAFMTTCIGNVTGFGIEHAVFRREYRSSMYGVCSYFLSRLCVLLPIYLVLPLISTFILYFMLGLQSGLSHFLVFYLVLSCSYITGLLLGVLLCCVAPDVDRALALTPLFVLPMMLFSGLYVNLNSVGAWLSWVQHLSPVKYAFTAAMVNEYAGLKFTCEETCVYQSGEQVLRDLFGDNFLSIADNVAVICSFMAAIIVMSMFFLKKNA